MVDAINSATANAPALRNVEQQEQSLRIEAPEPVAEFAQAPFISPVVSIDTRFDTAVLLLRNSENGDVVEQIPSESSLEASQRRQAREAAADLQETISNAPQFVQVQQNSTPDVEPTQTVTESVSSSTEIQEASASASSLNAIQSLTALSQSTGQIGSNVNVTA